MKKEIELNSNDYHQILIEIIEIFEECKRLRNKNCSIVELSILCEMINERMKRNERFKFFQFEVFVYLFQLLLIEFQIRILILILILN